MEADGWVEPPLGKESDAKERFTAPALNDPQLVPYPDPIRRSRYSAITLASCAEQAAYPSGRTRQMPSGLRGFLTSGSSTPWNRSSKLATAPFCSAKRANNGFPPDPGGVVSAVGTTRSPGFGPVPPCRPDPFRGL